MESLTCELNGIKYLLFEQPVSSNSSIKNLIAKSEKYDCIIQGAKDVKIGGLFSDSHMIIKVLVPEKNVIYWNKEKI